MSPLESFEAELEGLFWEHVEEGLAFDDALLGMRALAEAIEAEPGREVADAR